MEIYTVKPGDTAAEVAAQFGVPFERLLADNGLSASDALVPGQAVVIQIPSEVVTAAAGDTIESIAERTGTTVRTLLRNNPLILESGTLYEGQTVVVAFDKPPQTTIAVNGYVYPNVDRELLRQNLPFLTYLTIFSYGIKADGTLLPLSGDEPLIEAAKAGGVQPLFMLTTLGEDGKFDNTLSTVLLGDEQKQEALFDEIVAAVKAKGYYGVDVDFEFVLPAEREQYAGFINRLRGRLNAENVPLVVALAPKTSAAQPGLLYEAHDYALLGAAANNALLMTYEWGYTYGPPMAVSPIDKVEQVVAFAADNIPPERLFLGVPNYGYDWPLPYIKDETKATSLGCEQAVARAAQFGADIRFDETAQTPYYTYTDEAGQAHEVWFEDARSVAAKLDLWEKYALRGISVWNLMRPFAAAKTVVNARYIIEERTTAQNDL